MVYHTNIDIDYILILYISNHNIMIIDTIYIYNIYVRDGIIHTHIKISWSNRPLLKVYYDSIIYISLHPSIDGCL